MSASRWAATLPSVPEQLAPGIQPLRGRARGAGPFARLGAHHLALCGVLALSAVLNLNRLSQNGYANIFYSAGVKSMLRSLHNFFFVSFDPGGLIMVDKPPLGLWVQAASAKLFGFSPLSLLLPEAILGMLGVLLLYRALARRLGGWAGVAGALALAVFPSFVAISRTTNVDALLILLMILACDAGVRATETGRWRTLIWSAALVGLAFNTKTLAAYLVVPGIALGYLVCAGCPAPAPGPAAHGGPGAGSSCRAPWMTRRRTDARLQAAVRGQLDRQHRARPDLQLQRLRPCGRPNPRSGNIRRAPEGARAR